VKRVVKVVAVVMIVIDWLVRFRMGCWMLISETHVLVRRNMTNLCAYLLLLPPSPYSGMLVFMHDYTESKSKG